MANVVAFRAMRSFRNAFRPHLLALSSSSEDQVGHGQGEWDDWDVIGFDDDFGVEEIEIENKDRYSSAVQQGINSNTNGNPCKPWNEDAPYFDDDSLEENVHVMGKSVSQRIQSNIISTAASVIDAKREDIGVGENRNQRDDYLNHSFPWKNQRLLDAVQSISSILQLVTIILIALNQWKLMKVISELSDRSHRILQVKE